MNSKNHLILFLTTAEHVGGGEIALKNLIPEMVRQFSKISIKTVLPQGNVADFLKNVCETNYLVEPNFFNIVKTLNKIFKKNIDQFEKISIISCSPKAFKASWIFKKLFCFTKKSSCQKIKLFFYAHSKRNFFTSLFIAQTSDSIISVSLSLKKKFQTLGAFSKWVPNSVKKKNSYIKKSFDSSFQNRPVFIFLGRICQTKGIETIINAAEILDAKKIKNKSPLILVAGKRMFSKNSNSEKKLKKYSGKSLKYIGYLSPEKINITLEKCHALILPSLDEQFPICILEAQACKLPIIATSAGDIPQMVRHNIEGLIIKKNSPQELANSILLFAEKKEIAKKMGIHGYKRLNTLFSFSNWPNRFIRALCSL